MARTHPLRSIEWGLVGVLSLGGLLVGLMAALGATQDSIGNEVLAWVLVALVWVLVVLLRRTPRVFLHLLMISTLSGALYGAATQAAWQDYVANNPTTFRDPTVAAGQDPFDAEVRLINFALGVAIGLIWGVAVGGIASGIEWLRLRGPTPRPA